MRHWPLSLAPTLNPAWPHLEIHNYLRLQRPCFQVRSQSEVPGGHGHPPTQYTGSLPWVSPWSAANFPCFPTPSLHRAALQPHALPNSPMDPPDSPPLPSKAPWKSAGPLTSPRACGSRAGKTTLAESQLEEERESADLNIEALTDVALFNSAMGLLALVRSQHVC